MTWNQRYREALITAIVVAGGVFFATLANTTDAQTLASTTGSAAFATLAGQMGIAGVNARRDAHR